MTANGPPPCPPPRCAESIQELAAQHRAADSALAGLKAKYTNAKGWHFVVPQPKPATGRGVAREPPPLPKCARALPLACCP